MAANRFEEKSEVLTVGEAREVFAFVARHEGTASPRVEDVAETLGIGPDEVRKILTEVRTQPRATPPRTKRPPLASMGWALAAVAIAWAALKPSAASPTVVPSTLTTATPRLVPAPPTRLLREVAVVPLDLSPPEGYTIGVRAHGVVLSAGGRNDAFPKNPTATRERLAAAVSLLAQRAEEIGSTHAFEPRDPSVEPGLSPTLDVWVQGPAGNVSFTLTSEMHPGPASIVTLKERRGQILSSLDVMLKGKARVGPDTGIVGQYFPPAGFEVGFKGRRAQTLLSSPLAVVPLDEAAARERLFLAMRELMDADLKPVPGRWRQDAEAEKRLKTPDQSRFTIDTLADKLTFDVPTKPGASRAQQDAILRRKAAEAVASYVRSSGEKR